MPESTRQLIDELQQIDTPEAVHAVQYLSGFLAGYAAAMSDLHGQEDGGDGLHTTIPHA